MTNDLAKKQLINQASLSPKHYFQSLLQEARRLDLLSEAEFENIQMQSLRLLAEMADNYTGGASSSVRTETAQTILHSLAYCISVYLKSIPDADSAVERLRQEPLAEMLRSGRKLIDGLIRQGRLLLLAVQKDSLTTVNRAYNDTIQLELARFFTAYNPDYAGHEIPASLDYPVSNDLMNLTGIEYVVDYLQRLRLENRFCHFFADQDIESLLRGYDEQYQDMLVNIFELAAANSLGSVLAGQPASQLRISAAGKTGLLRKLAGKSRPELAETLQAAAVQGCLELGVTDPLLLAHLAGVAGRLAARLADAAESGRPDSPFIELRDYSPQVVDEYADGRKMSDDSFRRLSSELRECRFFSDKMAIIQRSVHSMADLIDLLEAACFFGEEFDALFKSLGDLELALLLQALPARQAIDPELPATDHGIDDGMEWQVKLNHYLAEMPASRRDKLHELAADTIVDAG